MRRVHPVRWFAPGRVNLIGEHTDYNLGFALPFAIELGCTASVEPLHEDMIEIRSRQKPSAVRLTSSDLHPGAGWLGGSDGWAGYAAGTVWAVRRWLGGQAPHAPGWRITIDSDVPVGAGLSSSAAICCAVTGAVADALELTISAGELAELARQTESEFVGAPTGGMDQLASACSRPDHVLLCDMRTNAVEPVPLRLAEAGLALLVVDTGAAHAHVGGEYAQRRASCTQAAAALGLPSLREATLADLDRLPSDLLRRRARHVVTENARVLAVVERLRSGRPAAIGDLLTQSHVSMREDFEITAHGVDLAVSALLGAGVLGARMTGGGFGGCVIGLVAAARVEQAAHAAADAFRRSTLAPPHSFVVRPSGGAHRAP